MKKLLLFLFLLPFVVKAQQKESFKESAYITQYIYDKAPNYTKNDKYNRLTYMFSIIAGKQISDELNSDLLLNWQEMEVYLNEVLQKVIPKELKNDSTIHVYIRKEGVFGADMTPAGQLYINLGAFAELTDEATLAAMMLHELAHYREQHYLKRFLINHTLGIDWGLFGSDKKPSSHFSQSQELAADSLASVWLKQTPYFHSGLLNYYRILERLENKKLARMENEWELKNPHFPPSKERIAYYEKEQEYAKPNLDNKQLFAVGETQFNTLKNQAKSLILEALLINPVDGGFDECIERAFAFHLLDPLNSTYIFYLMEAIRRQCYVYNNHWNQNFITYRYLDTTTIENVRKKIPLKYNLLEKFDKRFIALNSVELNNIKARFYWDDPPFITYEEAFEYFFKIANKLGDCKECLLSYALSYEYDKKLRDLYLKKYLAQSDTKYSLYASTLLQQDIETTVSNKKLVIIDGVIFAIREGNDLIYLEDNELNKAVIRDEIISELNNEFDDRHFVLIEDLKNESFKNYVLSSQLMDQFFGRGANKFKLYYLEPNFTQLFKSYDVSEVEFIHIEYVEFRKASKEIESMKYAHQTPYKELLDNQDNQKAMDLFWLGFTINNSTTFPFYFYFNEDIPIKSKISGKAAIISNIKKEISR